MQRFMEQSPYETAEELLASGVAADRRQALMMAVIMWSDIEEEHKGLHLAIAQKYGPDFQIWELSPDEQAQLEEDYKSGRLALRTKGSA
jgi:hypothetical protein